MITGSRAEYGLLSGLLREINAEKTLKLNLVVTGSHFSEKHGHSISEIEDDGFTVFAKIPLIEPDSSEISVSIAVADGLKSFAELFCKFRPDLLILLGDRFEIFSAAIAAHIQRIPIAHIHGGETTQGLIDEAFRHSITKMSQLHFVANDSYRNRVIQMGEVPSSVFTVGGLGVDMIARTALLTRSELENILGLSFSKRNLLVTYHPVTLHENSDEFGILLDSLSEIQNTQMIFTLPNADPNNEPIRQAILEFEKSKENVHVFESLGYRNYLSCLANVDAVVGNSSSGLLEAPTLRIPSVNIGDRQKGRLSASSVINCRGNKKEIINAIDKIYSPDFNKVIKETVNPYGQPGAAKKIINIIMGQSLDNLIVKQFYDLRPR